MIIITALYDYLLLLLSLLFLLLETVITALTILFPSRVIDGISNFLHFILPKSGAEKELDSDEELKARVRLVSDAIGFIDICDIHGFQANEHIVGTADGYMLGIHQIKPKNTTKRLGVVYLHHGLLMNSEIWVANYDASQSIALQLANEGYEVWLGNNRGNKYSKKHISRNPLSHEFWNFCLDEFAMYDIPATIDYILKMTNERSLTYIGFSQGSAQAFAALSIHPILNKQIHLFIALGPAMAPPRVGPRILHSLITASPSLLYTLFGHRIVLRSTVFWQSIILPALFIRMIDLSNNFLFKWKSKDITWAQKLTGYYHLYSYTSVKCVVHWFQVIARNNGLQMYDDDSFGMLASPLSSSVKFYQVSPYPTKNITTPIEIIYGTNDSLVDINSLLSKLPPPSGVHPIEGYEHLEMIWGRQVKGRILPKILDIIRAHSPHHEEISNGSSKSPALVHQLISPPKIADPCVSPDGSLSYDN